MDKNNTNSSSESESVPAQTKAESQPEQTNESKKSLVETSEPLEKTVTPAAEKPTSDETDDESRPTVEISSLLLQNEQQNEDGKKSETTASPSKPAVNEQANEQTSKTTSEAAESDSDARNSDSESKVNGHTSNNNSGLQTILVNLCEVIQQQLSPLLESVNLPAINIALATSNNGAISLNNIQQQLAVAQVATATQLQRAGPNTNPNQQRILNTASLLASQLSAAACAAAAVANSEESSQNKLSSNSTHSISPSTSPSLTSSSNGVSWNQQQQQQQMNNQQWQQQQQKPQQPTTAQAAAAAWTSALQNASAQSVNNLNQYQQRAGIAQQQKNPLMAQHQMKNSSSKGNGMNNIIAGQAMNSPNSSTMQQALNSIYSNASSHQMKTTNGAAARNNDYFQSGSQGQTQNSEDQEKLNTQGNGNAFDLSMLNSQLIELIRQDPSQLEQILKLKLYQGGDDVNGLIEELQQLDQTVPANLAAAAAAAVAANNQNMNRNSPRINQPQQNQNYQLSNYNLMQQQNLQMAQQHHNNMHGHNSHKQFPQNNYNQNSNNFPNNNQFQSQQHQQQQFHPNFLQLTLQQQQQLSQFQDYHEERFSRKVFVGGLPPDIDEDEIVTHFRRYGNLIVDWPHKAESKSYFPPKGYAFLIFQEERSVQDLIETCVMDDGKLYMVVSSPSMKDKPVQIRPWCLNDSDFVMDGSQPLDPRKTIFVGGVPRPLKAIELAMIMDRFYGGVCYAGIDTDPELKYPKGAGRVAFSNQQSYIAAISARFVQLQHGEIDKRVEVKPYVLDDQMCDECQGNRCGGKFAPFFCANVTCLQYYCEACWATIHTRQGREYHKPLVKEGADRPRPIPYK